MKLTFLGTGTSCGVPTIGCQCYTCSSPDQHDKRLRCSALLETETTRLLIDCGPDFRQQIMYQPFRKIDGILITHAHYDHVGGMDDIRPYCQFGEINVYADPLARQGMLQMLPYCFAEHRYPGVPAIQLHEIHKHESFWIGRQVITFQGHPEFTVAYSRHLLNNFCEDLDDAVKQTALQSLDRMEPQGQAAARDALDRLFGRN